MALTHPLENVVPICVGGTIVGHFSIRILISLLTDLARTYYSKLRARHSDVGCDRLGVSRIYFCLSFGDCRPSIVLQSWS